MNYLDWIIIIILLISAIKGYRKGLIYQLTSLAALVLGIYIAVKFSKWVSPFIQLHFVLSANFSKVIAFLFLFILVIILVNMLGRFLEKIFKGIELTNLNKITGSIFYITKITFLISIVMLLLRFSIINFNWPNTETIDKSYLYKPIESVAPSVFPYLKINQETKKQPVLQNKKQTVLQSNYLNFCHT